MPAKINLLNQKFGKLLVIEELDKRKNKSVVWKCQCDCGNIVECSTKELRSDGLIQCPSCGHNREPKKNSINEIGKQYGMFTIIEKTNKKQKDGKLLYKCQCKCGKVIEHNITEIKNGHLKSCGCLRTKYHIGEIINNRLLLEKIVKSQDDINRPKFKVKCILCGREYIALGQTIDKTISCGCQKSIGEYNIIKILKENDIPFIKEYCFPHSLYRFDFALLENKKITRLIEFDGEQHYYYKNSGWNTYEKYQKTYENDKNKNMLAKEYNIPLIRIPYWERDNITLDLILKDKYLVEERNDKNE